MKKQVNGRYVKLKKHVVDGLCRHLSRPVFSLVYANTKPVDGNSGVGQSLAFRRVDTPQRVGVFLRRLKSGLPVEVSALPSTPSGL